jgi:hypothetical protein
VENQTWDAEYQSYQIRATNKGSVFSPKITKALEINGILVKSIQGGFLRSCSTIFTTYNFNGIDREIEVRFAQKTKIGSKIGCQFFVDGEKIGGDRSIDYPDPIKSAKHLEKGFINYILSVGLLSYGLPISIGLGIVDLGSPLLIRVQRFIIYILFSSFIYSYFTWNQMKSIAEHRQNYNRSKNS